MGSPVQGVTSPLGYNYILDILGQVWKQSAPDSDTFNKLADEGRFRNGNGGLAWWNNYLVVFGDEMIEFNGNGTGDAGITGSNWNIINGSGQNVFTVFFEDSPDSGVAISGTTFPSPRIQVGDPVVFTTTGTLPPEVVAGTTYYIQALPMAGLFQISATRGGSAIIFTGVGSGTITMTDTSVPFPVSNLTNFDFTTTGPVNGATSFTIITYTRADGTVITGAWQEASGQWAIIDSTGAIILAVFTNGSEIGNFLSPFIVSNPPFDIHIVDPSVLKYHPYVSKVDGNLYFANGRYLGRLLAENLNVNFNPSAYFTYIVDYGVTAILQTSDTIQDMTDLQGRLVIAGNQDVYTWDYVSPTVTAPTPVGEQIYSIENLLSNIYILAGSKGNIYVSNGFSAQLLFKMPDFIAGVFDPIWSWGDLMVHRSRLWFQAIAQELDGTNILAGIFSLTVSPSAIGETASGLVMESQNSLALNLPQGALPDGILLDNEKWSSGVDSYYSVYSTSDTTGTVDFNDATLWADNEAVIETDIVPIGDFLDKNSYGNIEFKLDRPMVDGDSISLYWRPSLTDAYEFIGTTVTETLSDYNASNLAESQWAQFMVTTSCAAVGSSRVPIREIRLHFS